MNASYFVDTVELKRNFIERIMQPANKMEEFVCERVFYDLPIGGLNCITATLVIRDLAKSLEPVVPREVTHKLAVRHFCYFLRHTLYDYETHEDAKRLIEGIACTMLVDLYFGEEDRDCD